MCLEPPLRIDELPDTDMWYCRKCSSERVSISLFNMLNDRLEIVMLILLLKGNLNLYKSHSNRCINGWMRRIQYNLGYHRMLGSISWEVSLRSFLEASALVIGVNSSFLRGLHVSPRDCICDMKLKLTVGTGQRGEYVDAEEARTKFELVFAQSELTIQSQRISGGQRFNKGEGYKVPPRGLLCLWWIFLAFSLTVNRYAIAVQF
jgi:hypothetical protein